MKVLVTGGAGYVGSTLVDMLSRKNYIVRSIDNYSRGKYEEVQHLAERENVAFLKGDIRNVDQVATAMEEVDAVVHLAALPGLKLCSHHPKKAITTNIYGTRNLLDTAVANEVDRFIFASSAAVYGIPKEFPIEEREPLKPLNLYGVSKASGEQLVTMAHESEGLETVILRFGNIFGVGCYTYWQTVIPKFVRRGLNGKPLTVYGHGEQSRDFIHVKDVARGIIQCLQGDEDLVAGEAFNLGSGAATSVNTVARLVQQKVAELADRNVDIVHTEKREGEPYITNFRFTIEKIRETLGFEPQKKLEEGIEELIDKRTE